MNSNTTRTFQTQDVNCSPSTRPSAKESQNNSSVSGTKSQKVPIQKMVRTDSRDPFGRMHAYLQRGPALQSQQEFIPDLSSVREVVRLRRNAKDDANVCGLHELLRDIDSTVHTGLLDIVKNCTYVGLADEVFALVQHKTHLYLMNVVNVSKEVMYQQALRRFSQFNAIQLSEPAPVPELLMMALKEEDVESVGDEDDDVKKKIAEMNTELLKQKSKFLDDHFSIHIDQEGNLLRIPVILDQYIPDMDHVPEFLLSLSNDVDWEDEQACFQTISAILANFYAIHPPILPNPAGNGIQFYKKSKEQLKATNGAENQSSNTEDVGDDVDKELVAEAVTAWEQREWKFQHVLFPSLKIFLRPPNVMATNGTFVQVASLEKLYKIFERC